MSEVQIKFDILKKEYTVVCSGDERDDLLASAGEINQRINTVRKANKQLDNERAVVMVALNVMYELMLLQHQRELLAESNEQMLGRLMGKIDSAIRLHSK